MTKPQRHIAVRYLAKFSLVVLIALISFYFYISRPVVSGTDSQEFEVIKGDSVGVVANNLKSSGLIRSTLFFKYLVKLNKLTIQAGVYQISKSAPPIQIARSLTKGLAVDKKITIPEGYRREQIAELTGLTLSAPEGRLFPDTYFIKEDITQQELVSLMQDNFSKKVGQVDDKTLILASLIERETRGDSEKPIVAGILKKRLDSGWPLELDATIQYFLGKRGAWWPNTTLLDRKLKSPYNTYLNQGLPPGPICNPGLSSIRAAQNPVDSEYWFYLHDKSGVIHYAATSSEHNQNIEKYIR